ncbi:MBL fold metallo-hydrolase [Mycetocola sp. JXN-3]|uniref:MBL fold metallo-hydrolase n=1 Tax=Mycetocola sp. JXN-3 TaxID=2116510 RepID=UPI00165D103F|nr:MBL fold metallo-hydrolase [Mycetocola sp. JXN-3]
MSGTLRFDTLVSGLAPITGAPLPGGEQPNWSPLTHTLIFGERDAVLVDPPITADQTETLADWIAAHQRRLVAIYITHAHADHWLGTARLLERFPEARVYAGEAATARILAETADGTPGALWATLFPEQLPTPIRFPVEPAPAAGIELEGERLHSIAVGHSDMDDTTVLHVPALDLVVGGDIVYNNVHLYLAEARNGGFEAWHRALDAVEALNPAATIAGHKDASRDDSPVNVAETRRYLRDAEDILGTATTRLEFFTALTARYPKRVNAYTTWLSALRLFDH